MSTAEHIQRKEEGGSQSQRQNLRSPSREEAERGKCLCRCGRGTTVGEELVNILQSMGVDAQPMHVALGLEPNADGLEEREEEVKLPPVLVTSEGE